MDRKNLPAVCMALLIGALLAGCSAMLPTDPGASIGGGATQLAKAPAGGPSEGIKVHGHWVIEVRNPDGTLASRREFDNALSLQGAINLGNILGRSQTVGKWRLGLNGAPSPCNTQCIIGESADGGAESTLFKTLTVLPPSGNQGAPLKLSGTFTAQSPGNINTVSADPGACGGNIAPDSCNVVGFLGNPMTSTTLANPQSVVAGQQVQVTVTLSFS